MFSSTLDRLKCPRRKQLKGCCHGKLKLSSNYFAKKLPHLRCSEIISGHLICTQCQAKYPILGGVPILVNQVRKYLIEHMKGISQLISEKEIPPEFRADYLQAKSDFQVEHIDEDLEAERVNSLYLLTHYMRADERSEFKKKWWKPQFEDGSKLIDSLIQKYWDHGPFEKIESELNVDLRISNTPANVVELGCGVGGLYYRIKKNVKSYIGIDTSFLSISIARHLVLGMSYPKNLKYPEDLFQGSVSRKFKLQMEKNENSEIDFIVADIENPPLPLGSSDICISLNTIDMLDRPEILPEIQNQLLKSNGIAIQSSPYIWHPFVASQLRKKIPTRYHHSSSQAVEFLYQKVGFKILKKFSDLPWLFFKNVRQLEIYSIHLIFARKER